MWLFPLSDSDQQTFVAQHWRNGDSLFVLAYQVGVTNVEWRTTSGFSHFVATRDKPHNQAIHLAIACSTIYEFDANCKIYRNGILKTIARTANSSVDFPEAEAEAEFVRLAGPMAENYDLMRFPWIVGQSRRRCSLVYICYSI